MQIHSARQSATQQSAGNQLALAVLQAPVITAQAVDFRKGTWTFSLPAIPVGPGEYIVVRAAEARGALERDQNDIYLAPLTGTRRLAAGGDHIVWLADDGARVEAIQRRYCPDSWRNSHVHWHPSHWRVTEKRTDERGRSWETDSVVHVMNDFGDLVEVAE